MERVSSRNTLNSHWFPFLLSHTSFLFLCLSKGIPRKWLCRLLSVWTLKNMCVPLSVSRSSLFAVFSLRCQQVSYGDARGPVAAKTCRGTLCTFALRIKIGIAKWDCGLRVWRLKPPASLCPERFLDMKQTELIFKESERLGGFIQEHGSASSTQSDCEWKRCF